MQHAFTRVDKTIFKASKMEEQGNADFQFWFDKSVEERLVAAAIMISVCYREPEFMKKKVDRTIFSARKQNA
jgi:hypothetical protein